MKPDLHRSTLRCTGAYFPVQGHTESTCVQTGIRTPKPSSNLSGLIASEEEWGYSCQVLCPSFAWKIELLHAGHLEVSDNFFLVDHSRTVWGGGHS